MKPRISMITLGVRDLAASVRFYAKLKGPKLKGPGSHYLCRQIYPTPAPLITVLIYLISSFPRRREPS